MIYKKPSYR